MVNTCCVKDCTSRSSAGNGVTFHRIPMVITTKGTKLRELTEKRRRAWFNQIKRKGLDDKTAKSWTRVCSKHFVKGKPAELWDEQDPDWVPSLLMGYKCKPGDAERFQRSRNRQHQKGGTATVSCDNSEQGDEDGEVGNGMEINETGIEAESAVNEKSCGTEMTMDYIQCMEAELRTLRSENLDLKQRLSNVTISENFFKNNDADGSVDDDDKVKYYTGLPTLLTLTALLNFLSPSLSSGPRTVTTSFQDLLMMLMRLRLNLPVRVIADWFQVSPSRVSRNFLKMLDIMYARLFPLIHWPDRESLRRTMPYEFKQYFGNKVTVIIDCFELFIETPSNLLARAQTFSSYKHHNTIKYLIGIAPQGVVSFISKGWGGRTSDKWITENSGFLDKLSQGDVVLADRGFNIQESVGLMCAEVKIPAFTKGKKQLSAYDVEATRKIAHVRIHVERVIGNIIQKYPILDSTIPITMLCVAEGDTVTVLDKMVTVCCALVNTCPSVVPFD